MSITARIKTMSGWAIIPWWLNSSREMWEFFKHRPLTPRMEDVLDADMYCASYQRHGVWVYEIRHTDPGKSKLVTREEYCTRALTEFCGLLSRRLTFTFKGTWTVEVEGNCDQPPIHAVGESLEAACTTALGQLDDLWKR